MGRLLLQLLDFTHTFGMHLRPELVLLQKTMVQVEGVARNLDPEHNIWDAAKPIVQSWIREEFSPVSLAKQTSSILRDLSGRAGRLPEVLDRVEAIIEQDAKRPVPSDKDKLPGFFNTPVRSLITLALVVTGSVLLALYLFDTVFS